MVARSAWFLPIVLVACAQAKPPHDDTGVGPDPTPPTTTTPPSPTPDTSTPTVPYTPPDEEPWFSTTAIWASNGAPPVVAMDWADHDGDGDPDAALALNELAVVEVVQPYLIFDAADNGGRDQLLRHDGDAMTEVPLDDHDSMTVDWADLDADGQPDLVLGQLGAVYRNDGGALVLDGSAAPSGLPAHRRAFGDLNGDGLVDMVITEQGWTPFGPKEGQSHLAFQDLTGRFVVAGGTGDSPARQLEAVSLADVDGDGDLDLFEAALDRPNCLYDNDGAGALTRVWCDGKPGDDTTDVDWGDWDGDGDLDLVVANFTADSRIYRNDAGTLVEAETLWGVTTPRAVAWGDADGDGRLDLAFANAFGADQILLRDPDAFAPWWWSDEADESAAVSWVDWDGDGDLDLATAGPHRPVRVYGNRTSTVGLATNAPHPGLAGAPSTVKVFGATPGSPVSLFVGAGPGLTQVAGCGGQVWLDLDAATPIGDEPLADANGRAEVTLDLPLDDLGERRWFQVIDRGGCGVGPAVDLFVSGTTVTASGSPELLFPTAAQDTGPDLAAAGGDHDGDGFPDVLASVERADPAGRGEAGAVHVISGAPTAGALVAVGRLLGEVANDRAGERVAGGDLDGDGAPDVVTSSLRNDRYLSNGGAVYLVHGPVLGDRDLALADGRIYGDADYAPVGIDVAVLPSGPSGPEVAMSAGHGTQGAVHLHPGGLAGEARPADAATAVVLGRAGDLLGATLDVTDLDGDGTSDLVVGSPSASVGGAAAGKAHLLFGPLSGEARVDLLAAAELRGQGEAGLGASIATGDVTGDGRPDVLLGAPSAAAPTGAEPGAAWLVDGTVAGTHDVATVSVASVYGSVHLGAFGASVALVDIDRDSFLDLVVGAPEERHVTAELDSGAVYAIHGPVSGAIDLDEAVRWSGEDLVELLGVSLAVPGDVDGDGYDDVFAGTQERGGVGGVVLLQGHP